MNNVKGFLNRLFSSQKVTTMLSFAVIIFFWHPPIN